MTADHVRRSALDRAVRRLDASGRGQVIGLDYGQTVPSPIAGYPRAKTFDEAKRLRWQRDWGQGRPKA